MGTLDIILLVIFIPAIIRGLSKGMIEQLVAFASIFLSAYLAYTFADKVGELISQYITVAPSVLYIISFVVVIVLCVLLLNLLAKLLSKAIEMISLGWLDKILGLAFALLNSALVIGLLFILFKDVNTRLFHIETAFMDNSLIYGWISKLTDAVFPYLEDLFTKVSNGISEI